MNSRVWILIPVHNRKRTTSACLDNLLAIRLPDDFLVCVIDDGCSDGTSEMLRDTYPSVRVTRGDGNLFWGGGIALGMSEALKHSAEIHLWLNDDCLPDKGSLERLVNRVRATRGICGGVCYDPIHTDRLTYAGTPLEPIPSRQDAKQAVPIKAESLNGNLVAVHHEVLEKIGSFPSAALPHFGGDIAYTLRARRAGIPVEIDPGAVALNRRDNPLGKVMAERSTLRLWREISRVGSPLHFPTYWYLLRERFGWHAWFRWPAFFVRMIRINLALLYGH